MSSNPFEHEYAPEAVVRVPHGNFELFVTPRYADRYRARQYEPFSSAIVKRYLRPNATFVDVGAHYGYYTLLAARTCGAGSVIALEPVPETFQILQRNLRHNRAAAARAYNVAASDIRQMRAMNLTEASDSAGFYTHPLTRTLRTVDVETVPLDELLGDRPVHFIKIDVEGHELAVLRGLRATLARNPDLLLLVEFYPRIHENAGARPEALLGHLESQGFETFIVDEEQRKFYRLAGNPHSWRELLPGAGADHAAANLFCIPKERALFTTFFSHSASLAGAERSLLDLVRNMQRLGALAHVVVPSEGPLVEELRQAAVAVDIVPFCWWASPATEPRLQDYEMSLRNLGAYARELERINPRLMYTNTIVIPWGAIVALLLRLPHVWQTYEFGEKDHDLTFHLTLPETLRIIDALSERVIYCSRAVQEEFAGHLSPGKGALVYYTIRIPAGAAEERVERIFRHDDSLKLIIAGTVTPSKGQDQAVQAVLDLLSEGLSVELLILGSFREEDSYTKDLQARSARHSDRIVWKQVVHNPFPYMRQADALLMCSRCEALGRVTIEAMLLKKAVIGANTGGTPELIRDGETGLLYVAGDVKDLTRKIRTLAQDRHMCRRLGEAGHAFAQEQFAHRDAAAHVYRICRSLISEGSATLPRTRQFLFQLFSAHATHAQHMEQQTQQLARLVQRLAAVEASASWRITKPLRVAKRTVRTLLAPS